jgi:hemerythrin-like domain-containing protein
MPLELADPSRRFAMAAVAGVALVLPACTENSRPGNASEDVLATEDLCREHGVLRRIMMAYGDLAPMLRAGTKIDAAALVQAANLFQHFGEDYHERLLEEQHVFPAVQKAGGYAAGVIGTLYQQHQRGREITAYIQQTCARGVVGAADQAPLAGVLESFNRMYRAHAAWEDTVVFPAWKHTMSKSQLNEISEQFEDIERKTFHGDGFDWALEQVSQIEQRLGLHDLNKFTAPPPPAPVNVTTVTTVKGQGKSN